MLTLDSQFHSQLFLQSQCVVFAITFATLDLLPPSLTPFLSIDMDFVGPTFDLAQGDTLT